MKHFCLLSAFTLCLSFMGFSQGALISPGPGNPPHPSAILELSDTTRGFLLPRLTTTQRNSVVSPAIGLQIYNLTNNCVEVYFPNMGWKQTACECTVAPQQPGNISGAAQFCANQQGIQYSVTPDPNATSYAWTVPPGATVATGQGTNTITVNFGNTGGNVTVTAVNSCGSSPVRQMAVSLSSPTASFTPTSGSINNPVTFTPQAGYISYSWTFQSGSPATSNIQNPQVTWTQQGTYAVTLTVVNSLGCTATATQNMIITTCQPMSMTFTHCGAIGRLGPSQQQCDNTYGPGVVTSVGGIQEWIVPSTGNFRITAYGGQGSLTNGAPGAIIGATVYLTAGSKLLILVGQQGENVGGSYAGGGGGTFVAMGASYTTATPLVIAGGGGGVYNGSSLSPNAYGSTNEAGNAGMDGTAGGTNGNGGSASLGGNAPSAGGGGFYTNGGSVTGSRPAEGGFAFQNGGNGGRGETSMGSGITGRPDGAFGGAGGAANYPGGGGGYSGGGGSGNGNANRTSGGGGSFVDPTGTSVATSNGLYNNNSNFNGSPIQNLAAFNNGNGYVTIVRTCP